MLKGRCATAVARLMAARVRRLHVCLAGTDDVTLSVLERLHDSLTQADGKGLVTRLTVITPSARPMGRGHKAKQPPVLEFAERHKWEMCGDSELSFAAASARNHATVVTVPFGT